ncbi:tRNA (guanosine(46)-N7)-methyltransferase TrmB [Methylococcaceae bacterium HT4]|nr:tRNA (guanosine(46)-N7)-methyltransferase TrmB [Methylococcaceae bacterium HT4]TXL18844.1 tRNA (guanosine(46)-N7)-methyltransferase TrmB [Methylococcaceae bacterium HT5]TXL22952.1 tRNA (guanosine(46)-N7)-methyltransferase TrmB [Methylococcaceae bacterium HT2]
MASLAEGQEVPRIKSFIRRIGRMTTAQRYALDTLWGKYCLDHELVCDFAEIFGRRGPVILEIGFGNGESLAKTALENPDKDYIGIEVHKPGVGNLLAQLERQGISNVRIFYHDAIEVLEKCIPGHGLSGVHLFFPDPWHKRKHHKRRIVRPAFVHLIAQKLVAGGYFHAATDWQHYAQHILKILTAAEVFSNQSPSQDYCSRPDYRPLTKFEQRGLRLGHGVWDLIFIRS